MYLFRRVIFCLFLFALLLSKADARSRKVKDDELENLALMLEAIQEPSPQTWFRGMPFLYVSDRMDLSLVPEAPDVMRDTLPSYGSIWHYDSMVSEEDWMGRQLMQLRFLAPDGRAFRYSTGKLLASGMDSNYQPAIASLYPQQIVQSVDSLLRARTLYILLSDDRVFFADDTLAEHSSHLKFVPVTVDSVCLGREVAPLCVHFSSNNQSGHFYASLPNSRQEATSTVITRFLSSVDPYASHSDITAEVWQLIQRSQIQVDMTAEEVRLSWGRPSQVERVPSRTGMIEIWYYSNNRVLQIWDGRLNKIGIL